MFWSPKLCAAAGIAPKASAIAPANILFIAHLLRRFAD
jgi:hypothetical protein